MIENIVSIIVFIIIYILNRKRINNYNSKNMVGIIAIIYLLTIGLVISTSINAVVVAVLFLTTIIRTHLVKRYIRDLYIIIAFCIVYLLVNTSFIYSSKEYLLGFNPYLGLIEYIVYFIYFLYLKTKKFSENDRNNILDTISLFSIAILIVAVFELPGGTSVLFRVQVIFSNPNLLGVYSSIILALNVIPRQSNLGKPIKGLILFSTSLLLLLSQSRVAWLAMLLFIGYMLIRSDLKSRFKGILIIGIIMLIAVVGFSSEIGTIYNTRILSAFNSQDTSTSDRLKLVELTLDIFKQNPILGSGIRSFPMEMRDSNIRFWSANIFHPHNAYLEMLESLGLVGAVFWLTIIIKAFKNGERIVDNRYRVALIVLFATIGLLNRLFNESVTSMLLWTILAFV